MRKALSFSSFLFLFLILVSCHTTSHKVVERSKKEMPRWVQSQGAHQIYAFKGGIRVVFLKKGVEDITLGILQSQQQALAYSYQKIYDKILKDSLKSFSQLPGEDRKALQSTGLRVIERVFRNKGVIEDIYYEKLTFPRGSENVDSYIVYILCYVDKAVIRMAATQIKRKLIGSTSPNLRLLGRQFLEPEI